MEASSVNQISLTESWGKKNEERDSDVTVDSSSIFKRKKTPGGIKYAKSPYMYQA